MPDTFPPVKRRDGYVKFRADILPLLAMLSLSSRDAFITVVQKKKKERKETLFVCMPIGVSANSRASFWAEMKDETTKYDDCVLISFFSPCLVKEFSLELKSFRSNVRVANDIVFHLSEHAVSIARTGALIWLFPSLSPDIEEEEEEEEEEGNRVGYDNKF